MAACECRGPDRPAADPAARKVQFQTANIGDIDDVGTDTGRIELLGLDAARGEAVRRERARADAACVERGGIDLCGRERPCVDTFRSDVRQPGRNLLFESFGNGLQRCCPLQAHRLGEGYLSRIVPKDVASGQCSGARRLQTPPVAAQTVRGECHGARTCRIAAGGIVLRPAENRFAVDRPAADRSALHVERQGLDIFGRQKPGFQFVDIQTLRIDDSGCDLPGVEHDSPHRIGRERAREKTVLVDVGRTDPLHRNRFAERDFPRRGIVTDRLFATAERYAARRIYGKCLLSAVETVQPVDRLTLELSGLIA